MTKFSYTSGEPKGKAEDESPFSAQFEDSELTQPQPDYYRQVSEAMRNRYRERQREREALAGETEPNALPLSEVRGFDITKPTRDQLRNAHERYDDNGGNLIMETEIILDSWVHFGGKPLTISEFQDAIQMLQEFRYPWIPPKTVQMNTRTAFEIELSTESIGALIHNRPPNPTIGNQGQILGIDIRRNEGVPGSMAMFFDETGDFIFGFMAFGYQYTGTPDDAGALWRMPEKPRRLTVQDYIRNSTTTMNDRSGKNTPLSDEDLDDAADEAFASSGFGRIVDEIIGVDDDE